jgi:hypothetical protein
VLIFGEKDDKVWECYSKAITAKNYAAQCDFSGVETMLNVQSYEDVLQSLADNEMSYKHIVIDNSPLP